ncbi:MAG: MFS transporter [Candidatus Zipacnadales bacterium]
MRANHHSPLVKRNFVLGVVNGGLWQLANAFLHPSTVLPAFVLALGHGEKIWIGIISACIASGWSWPQVILGRYLSTKQRLLPYYWVSAAGRAIVIIVLTLLVASLHDINPGVVFAGVASLFFIYGSCGAIGIIPFHIIVCDSMPASLRGRFFGMRWLSGGLLAMGGGIVVERILSQDRGLPYPQNYVTLFSLAAIVFIASVIAFSFVKEPPHYTQRHQLSMVMEFARGPRLMRRDRDWRLLLGANVLTAIASGLTVPYMAPFALQSLGAPEAVVGVFLSCQASAGAVSNILWSYVGDRRGNRKLLMWSSVAGVLPAILALLALAIPPTPLGTWFGVPFTLRLAVFALAFVPLGFSMSGTTMGQTNFLLDLAPSQRRPTYLAFSQLVMFPLAWWPVGGAFIIGDSRFAWGFGLAVVASVAACIVVAQLREPRAADLGIQTNDQAVAAGG